MSTLAIPEPEQYDRSSFDDLVPRILAWLDEVEDFDIVLETQARALALEDYLARRAEDVGPAQRVARMSEVRIGELIGPAPGRGRDDQDSARGVLHWQRRTEFRLMAEWRALVADLGGGSRREVLRAIERRRRQAIDAEARTITTLRAGDLIGEGWTMLAGTLAERLGDLEDAGIDMIVTDPPYATEFLELWDELGTAAQKVLKPQGILCALTGQIQFPSVVLLLSELLNYGWTYVQPQPGSHSRILARHVTQTWKPWLAFSNGPWPSGRVDWHDDTLVPVSKTKTRYRWEQPAGPARQLVEELCPEGGVVLDPFCGTGTYGVAALTAGRRFIGIEPDARRLAQAAERLEKFANP